MAETAVPEVDDDEIVLRRVVCQWMSDTAPPQFNVLVFRPRQPSKDGAGDVDGLSLSRERYPSIEQVAASNSPKKSHVAALTVHRIKALRRGEEKLTVVAAPTASDRGHVLIPELTSTDFDANKTRLTEWSAELASIATVVHKASRD